MGSKRSTPLSHLTLLDRILVGQHLSSPFLASVSLPHISLHLASLREASSLPQCQAYLPPYTNMQATHFFHSRNHLRTGLPRVATSHIYTWAAGYSTHPLVSTTNDTMCDMSLLRSIGTMVLWITCPSIPPPLTYSLGLIPFRRRQSHRHGVPRPKTSQVRHSTPPWHIGMAKS